MAESKYESFVGYVTTFHTPSLFFFIYKDDITARNDFNDRLNAPSASYQPVKNALEGQKVIIQHGEEWVRAKVAAIIPDESPLTEYICWLLDYGIFVVTNRVCKLPEEAKIVPPFVRKAMLYGLQSVIMSFDFGAKTYQEHRESEWVPGIRQCATDILKMPNIIQTFQKRFQFDDYLIGDIYIKHPEEGFYYLGDKIIAKGLAKFDEASFMASLKNAKMVEKPLSVVYNQTRFFSEQDSSKLIQNQKRAVGRGTFRSLQTIIKEGHKKSRNYRSAYFCDAENDESLFPLEVQEQRNQKKKNKEDNTPSVFDSIPKEELVDTMKDLNIFSRRDIKIRSENRDKEQNISNKKYDYTKFDDTENNLDSVALKNIYPAGVVIKRKQNTPNKNEQISEKPITVGRGIQIPSEKITDCLVNTSISPGLLLKKKVDIGYSSIVKSIGRGFTKSSSSETEKNASEDEKAVKTNITHVMKSVGRGFGNKSLKTDSETDTTDEFEPLGRGLGKYSIKTDNNEKFKSIGRGLRKSSFSETEENASDDEKSVKTNITHLMKSVGRGLGNKSLKTDSGTDTTDEFESFGLGLRKQSTKTDNIDQFKSMGRGKKSVKSDSDYDILSSDELKSYGRGFGKRKSTTSSSEEMEKTFYTKNVTESSDDTFDDADETKLNKSVFRNSGPTLDVINCTPAGALMQNSNFQFAVNPKRPPQEEKFHMSKDPAKTFRETFKNDNSVKHTSKTIAGLCHCNICSGWRNNEKFFEPIKNEKPKPKQKTVIRPSLLFKTKVDESENDYVVQTKREFDNETEKLSAPRVLVHGHFRADPVYDLPHIPFFEPIQRALRDMKYSTAFSIQTYAWNSVLRGHNAIIVSGPDCGKTMVYVPTICNFQLSNVPGLPEGKGPMSIILCPRVKTVEQIYRLFNRIMKRGTNANVQAVVQLYEKIVVTRLARGVDILITTPRLLIKILRANFFQLNRLCHIVLEEAHEIYSLFPAEVDYILKKIHKVLANRTDLITIQVIVVSQEWIKPIEDLAIKLKTPPLICIGAHLEAAFYGKADIKIQIADSTEKTAKLIEIIKDNAKYRKTVIMCSDFDDASELLKYLDTHGILYESLLMEAPIEDINAIKSRWLLSNPGHYFVLVCSDNIFNTALAISDADVIIQYSLPENWSQFTFRFSGFIDKYSSPLVTKNKEIDRCLMHIIVDETNMKQFPKMIQFLQRMGTKLTQSLTNFYFELTAEMELERLHSKTRLCKELLSFGSCRNIISCKFRHMLCPKTDVSHSLPHSGLIKFKILHTESPNHYYARLLEHTDSKGVSHDFSDYYSVIATQLLTLKNTNNKLQVFNVKVGTLCAVQESGGIMKGTFQRCKILDFVKIGHLIKHVLVRLIDLGWDQKVMVTQLFVLPPKLQNIPAQAVSIFISNIGPADKDLTWPYRCTVLLTRDFRKAGYSQVNCFFRSRIKLQIGDALLVDDLNLQEVLDDQTLLVHKMSVCETLARMKSFEKRPEHLEKLYEHCKKYNIPLEDYSLPVLNAIKKLDPQVKPTWAHLENDVEYNVVYFSMAHNPDTFFVKHSKNTDCLEQLYRDINTAMNKPFYRSVVSAMEGRCYVVKDPEEDKYARVIVKKLKVTTAECLFVDYGDCVEVSINELKFIPDELITQLPFQAIECKLYGIKPIKPEEDWLSEATDVFYDIAYERASDIFRYLHVKVMDEEKAQYTGYKKYSVILIDTYEEDKVINNLLLELGYAAQITDKIIEVDFEKCRFKSFNNENSEECEEEIKDIVKYKSLATIAETEDNANEAEKWDFHCNDVEDFWRCLLPKKFASIANSTAIQSETITELNSEENSSSKALPLPNPGFSTPNIIWQQTNTDITLRIQITGVEEYKVNILRGRMFSFKTTCRDITYRVDLSLFEKVSPQIDHSSLGLYVLVKMVKISPEEWPRLVLTKEKQRNITYNVAVIPIDDESDDENPLPIEKIKNSKKCGDELKKDDENGPYVYEVGSDIDWDDSDVESERDSDAS